MIRMKIVDKGCPQRTLSTFDFREVIEILLRATEQNAHLRMSLPHEGELICEAGQDRLEITVIEDKHTEFLSNFATAYDHNRSAAPYVLIHWTLLWMQDAPYGYNEPLAEMQTLSPQQLSCFAWYVGLFDRNAEDSLTWVREEL